MNVQTFQEKYPDKEAAMHAVEHEIEMRMKLLNEDWAVFQATKILGVKQGKRKLGISRCAASSLQ